MRPRSDLRCWITVRAFGYSLSLHGDRSQRAESGWSGIGSPHPCNCSLPDTVLPIPAVAVTRISRDDGRTFLDEPDDRCRKSHDRHY